MLDRPTAPIAPGDRVRATQFNSGPGTVARVVAGAAFVRWDDPARGTEHPVALHGLERIEQARPAASTRAAPEDDGPPIPPLEAYAFEAAREPTDEPREPAQPRGTTIVPGLSERAAAIRAAAHSLHTIKPVLAGRYLVKGWLDRGTLSSVIAGPKSGKTFAMLDMALHVAAGRPWHGFKVAAPGRVLYVACEGGAGVLNRVEAFKRANPDLTEAADDRFVLLRLVVDFGTGIDVAPLLEAMGTDWDLIIVDTLARAMAGRDENSAQDMGAFVRSCDAIREQTGAHVCVIHHTGKDVERGGRGSSALFGAVDTEIFMSKGEGGTRMWLEEARDMPSGTEIAFTLRDVEIGVDEEGDPVVSAVIEITDVDSVKGPPKLSPNASKVLEALRQYVDDCGVPCPGGTGWPEAGSRRVVDREAFTSFAAGKMGADRERDRKRHAGDAIDRLIAAKHVQQNAGMLWLL